MMKKYLYLLLLVLLTFGASAQEKKVCFTIDDLPTVTNGIKGYDFRMTITQNLVEGLVRNEIPAIGYVNESKLYDGEQLDSAEVKLLEVWLENGLELGNHSFSHHNFHKVSFETFTQDILDGEKVTKPLCTKYGTEYKFFRHPYLRSGMRQSQSDSLNQFLQAHGYTEAPVTVDNVDYLFALAFSRAYKSGDQALMDQIGKDYIQYQEDMLVYFEKQSERLFGRAINQILLLHANYLNATYIDQLAAMYRENGYTFVSQSEVLEDPAYQTEVTKFGDWGISWIDRWAMSKGVKGDFFKEEPSAPAYITNR